MRPNHELPMGVGKNGELLADLCTPEKKLRHLRNVTATVMRDALDLWADMWEQMKGCVTGGGMVLPEAEKKGFKPECGWPEFLEKMWLLKHYLDHIKKLSEGKT